MDESNSLNEGISLYNQRNYEDALTSFLSISDDDVNPVEVAYYVGLCYSKLKRYDDALLYLEQVVTAEGEVDSELDIQRALQCRYLLAVIYCTTGRRKLADFELKQLLDLGYKKSSVYASLAFISWEENNIEKCIEYYNKSLAEDGENPTALNGLGYVLANEERDLARALSYCQKAISIAPNSPACLDSLGWVYYKMKLYGESKKYLQQAKQKDPSNKLIDEHLKYVLQEEE